MARRDWEHVKQTLDAFLVRRDPSLAAAADPVAFPRRYAGRDDQETAALIAASLAFGRVASIRAKAGDAFARMGSSPAAYVDGLDASRARRDFASWRHRMAGPGHLIALLAGIREVRARFGSLEAAYPAALSAREALTRFAKALRGKRDPGILLADPGLGGACKRLNLFLRWMVRPEDGIDLGLWTSVSPARLVIPLDTHIHRIARYTGLTRLKTARWETAADITRNLARLDPSDPLKYDFALCHLGIAGDCPRRRVPAICARCDLNPICRLPGRRE